MKVKSDILFSTLVEQYLNDMQHRLREDTMVTKRYLVDLKITPYFKNLKVNDINTITIRNWQNKLLEYKDENGNPYKDTYLATINNQMSAIMNYAVKHYGLLQNPCRLAGSIGKGKADEMTIWTEDQFKKAQFYEKKSGYRVAFDILFYSGLREGELLALTPADILPSKQIDVNKTFHVIKGVEKVGPPKTPRSIRKVAIPDFLYKEITEYIGKLYGIENDERIFIVTKHGLGKELHSLAEKSGNPDIRVHDLRHSHASLLISKGVSLVEISRRLGHEKIKTTADTYGHLYPNEDPDIASMLESTASRKPKKKKA